MNEVTSTMYKPLHHQTRKFLHQVTYNTITIQSRIFTKIQSICSKQHYKVINESHNSFIVGDFASKYILIIKITNSDHQNIF